MDDYPNLTNQTEENRKEVLKRLVQSIEGMDDEALHDVFVSRAIKKATWSEGALLAGLENTVWNSLSEFNPPEDITFDELFKEIGVED